MRSRVQKGIIAGAVATAAVAVLELGNMLMGSPVMAFPAIVASMFGMPDNLVLGWGAHLITGTIVLGGLFGYLCPKLPSDTPATKGITFAVGAMVVMMVVVLLFGNPRMFGGSDGFGTIAWMLFTHAIFGIVLGTVFGTLVEREKRTLRGLSGTAPVH